MSEAGYLTIGSSTRIWEPRYKLTLFLIITNGAFSVIAFAKKATATGKYCSPMCTCTDKDGWQTFRTEERDRTGVSDIDWRIERFEVTHGTRGLQYHGLRSVPPATSFAMSC